MRTEQFDDYDALTLAQRCDAMKEAREMARHDHETGWNLIPFQADDPRYDAYLNERNKLRVALGKRPFRAPRAITK